MNTKWTIGKKLIVSFMVVAAITLLLGVVGYYGTVESDKSINELGIVRLPSVQSLLVMSEAQTAVDGIENALLSREIDLKARQEAYVKFTATWKRADDAWKVFEPLPQTVEETAIWKQFDPAWAAWKKDHQTFVALSNEYDKTVEAQQKAAELHAKMVKALEVIHVTFAKAEALLNQMVELHRAKADKTDATYTRVGHYHQPGH